MSLPDPEQWRRVQPVLNQALTLLPHERSSWLATACAGDPELRAIVQRLLDADAAPGGLLDTPSAVFLDDIIREIEREIPTLTGRGRHPLAESRRTSTGEYLPGTMLAGRYRIVSLLGRGGMGDVYRADDVRLGQPVALKFVAPHLRGNPEYLARLTSEVRLARHVSHPNVCRVFDLGEAEGRPFLSMEYVDGEDLAALLARIGYLPQVKAIDIARQLCAGLEAAHRLGVLHRDLKPANVMLDGRGQVRITDFGLALASGTPGDARARAGTPAYMAPEQREGREATVRSDLYALGLVLYELFTGTRAFQAASLEDLRRLQEESSPTPPSRLIDGFNPAIERAILSCLERDRDLRPASASAVAAALPGGDPIGAALAAGVTPSPELVAVSGPDVALSARRATTILSVTVAALVALLVLSDRASILGWNPLTHSPEVLADRARGIVQRLGYDARPMDHASDFDFLIGTYVRYVQRQDTSPDRWEPLREPGQIPTYFFYRQAGRYLAPLSWNGRVNSADPALQPGDIVMTTDLRGRLIYFQAVPAEAARASASAPSFDWSRLLKEAGLDLTQFTPVAPTRNPPVTTDVRAAWSGVLGDFGRYPVRVEAAVHQGRPVFFELVVPWDPYWDPSSDLPPPSRTRAPAALYFLVIVFGLATAGVLVVRNWTSGRGDRRGAFRLAALVFSLRFAVWMLGGHHVPSFWEEFQMFVTAFGKSLIDAAVTWCYYLALEPYARRLYPRLLVSWTRMLRGHLRDPLVGRDILYGVALSTITIACWAQLYVLIPQVLQLSAPPPPVTHGIGAGPYALFLDPPESKTILGGRHVLEGLAAMVLYALGLAMTIPMLQLGMRMVLRRQWAANAVFLMLTSLLAWPAEFSGFSAIAVACTFVGAVAILWALKNSLVSLLVLWFCLGVWLNFPVTMRVDAPYFGTGLVGVLTIAGLAIYGSITAAHPRLVRHS